MEKKWEYRLITGKDDSSFCERISGLLEKGYTLYGSPSVTYNGKHVIAAQAVIVPKDNKEFGKHSTDKP
ncbi:MAG: DUF1737 domain-containing protein [Desulfobacteraceae bacterium]|nr:DUF1737 domain-containing protein [Desulfobacteraceae bacterium]